MELDVNVIGAEIVFEIVLILCFNVLIFVVKDQLCSVNFSKKIRCSVNEYYVLMF